MRPLLNGGTLIRRSMGMHWLLVALAVLFIGGLLYSFRRTTVVGHLSSAGQSTFVTHPPSAGRQAQLDTMLTQLDLVEAELRRLGWWLDSQHAPSERDASKIYAGLPFDQWLQYEFLPTARSRIRDNSPPASSMVGVMAVRQYDYHSLVEEALPLVRLLNEFDDIVVRAGRS